MSYCTAALDTIACATALQRASSRQFGSGQGAARCSLAILHARVGHYNPAA
jgi:hypothetical protein